jgi:ubiquinone/menaquinone biosynthesis C-methylase UbiE
VIALTPSPLGTEALDDPACPAPVAAATLTDIALVNALFGGRAAAAYGLRRLLDGIPPETRLTLLDVGAGIGDVARALVRTAGRRGLRLTPIALDLHRVAARLARDRGTPSAVGSAASLPFRPGDIDIVLASQFLHHFARESASALIQEFHRLARRGVVICEPRRSPVAAGGIWLAASALRLHRVTRRDGVLSVQRSFTARELAELLARAGVRAHVHRRPGFRVVAWWRTDADG